MATVTKGRTFVSGETVTPAKLNELVDSATVTAIQTADIADGQITNAKVNASAAIAYSKLNLANSIVAADIASNAVETAKLKDAAVTATKLDGAQTGSAPIYGCRAWVNFDGTRNAADTGASTNGANVKIRSSGNVASVLKNATGDYTITFTAAMPDANYSAVMAGSYASSAGCLAVNHSTAPTSSAVRVVHGHFAGSGTTGYPSDVTYGMVSIFR